MGILGWLRPQQSRIEAVEKVDEDELVEVDIVGESKYQAALAKIAGPKTEDGKHVRVTAQLLPEPSNPHDRNAVAVYVQQAKVGYLSRDQAKGYHAMMRARKLKPETATMEMPAEVRGGWKRRGGNEGHYGLKLLMPEEFADLIG